MHVGFDGTGAAGRTAPATAATVAGAAFPNVGGDYAAMNLGGFFRGIDPAAAAAAPYNGAFLGAGFGHFANTGAAASATAPGQFGAGLFGSGALLGGAPFMGIPGAYTQPGALGAPPTHPSMVGHPALTPYGMGRVPDATAMAMMPGQMGGMCAAPGPALGAAPAAAAVAAATAAGGAAGTGGCGAGGQSRGGRSGGADRDGGGGRRDRGDRDGKGGKGGDQAKGKGKKSSGSSDRKGGSQPFSNADKSDANHSNLFVGSLPQDITEETIKKVFSEVGPVLSCRVFSRNDRHCALVKMGSVQAAQQARNVVSQRGWLVKPAHADSGDGRGDFGGGGKSGGKGGGGKQERNFGGGGGGGGGGGWGSWGGNANSNSGGRTGKQRQDREPLGDPSECLYVRGLPITVSEGQLLKTFQKAGILEETKIMRYWDTMESAALLRMDSLESAKKAIDTLAGTPLADTVPPISVTYHGKDSSEKGDNVFVKGLPPGMSSEELQVVFARIGTVRRCRIFPPQHFSPNDAAGLVQMGSPQEAAAAIKELSGTVLQNMGVPMSIRYAAHKLEKEPEQPPNTNLYVKGLPYGTPNDLLRSIFDKYGKVTWAKTMEPRNSLAVDCVAIVEMSTLDEAKEALQALHGTKLEVPMPPMRVRFAGKEQKPGNNLYVTGLPYEILEGHLRSMFEKAGRVTRLRFVGGPDSWEPHALIQMASEEDAQKAIDELNGTVPEVEAPVLIVKYAKPWNQDKKD
eukprot:TRINITY_DN10073_c0_g2_i1.p1 TRINITY_DN10073_c0_g2~~TRINITY_DN10073_c0_g2_i1.p1  ORF type:complete len:741 (-),score=147.08 TRINITY_DN10073_c0_g2_i1:154-2376(-)